MEIAAVLFDHLRRVAREMFLQKLEHASWMLESFVFIVFVQVRRSVPALLLMAALFFGVIRGMRLRLLTRLRRRGFVEPARGVVCLLLGIPAGENTAEIFGVLEIFRDDYGCIRIVHDVVAKV